MIPKIFDSIEPIQEAVGYTLSTMKENKVPVSAFFMAREDTGNIIVSMVREAEAQEGSLALFPIDDHFESVHVIPIGEEFAKIPLILQAYLIEYTGFTGIEIPPPIITGNQKSSYTLTFHFQLPIR